MINHEDGKYPCYILI